MSQIPAAFSFFSVLFYHTHTYTKNISCTRNDCATVRVAVKKVFSLKKKKKRSWFRLLVTASLLDKNIFLPIDSLLWTPHILASWLRLKKSGRQPKKTSQHETVVLRNEWKSPFSGCGKLLPQWVDTYQWCSISSGFLNVCLRDMHICAYVCVHIFE